MRPANYYLYRLRNQAAFMAGELRHNTIRAFWELRFSNSGDLITPLLLKRYGFTPVHGYPEEAEVFSCGSLMEKVPPGFSGFILGTGFMHRESQHSIEDATILALRGELTRDKIGAPAGTPLGDPGLLLSRLLKKRQTKRYKVGLIPHFVDKGNSRLQEIYQKYKRDILFINIQQSPLTVLRQVDQCDCILSSSLHGLVFADSLNIPNVWLELSDRVSGKGFKFHDYSSALAKEQEPVQLNGVDTLTALTDRAHSANRSMVERVQANLDGAFRLLGEKARLRKALHPASSGK